MISRALAHVRTRLVSGLLLVLPLLITLWLLRILFRVIDDNVTPAVLLLLGGERSPLLGPLPAGIVAPVIGLLLTVGSIYVLGLVAGNLVGKKAWSLVETGILRIPLVKGIYGSARQLLDAFSVTHGGLSKVVLVEYPRAGLWTVGFVTNDTGIRFGEAGADDHVAVFLPTAPNPTSGWVVLVRREEIVVLDMSIDEGIKLVVSGGIVAPRDLGGRAQPPAVAPGASGASGR